MITELSNDIFFSSAYPYFHQHNLVIYFETVMCLIDAVDNSVISSGYTTPSSLALSSFVYGNQNPMFYEPPSSPSPP
jgi:hypothetical protein